jgi:hypothetical protein
MARAHVYKVLINTDGSVLTGASVQVNDDSGSATPQTLYANETGGTTKTNPFTADVGIVEFWLANPERLSIVVTPTIGSPTTFVTDAHPAASQEIVDSSAPLTITNAPAAGKVLTGVDGVSAEFDYPVNTVVLNTQTNNYTLVLTDSAKVVEVNATTAKTLTVPPNSSVAFPVGTVIEVDQIGAGQVTITPGAGVTLHALGGALKLSGQYAACSLRKRGTDEWVVVGSLST